MCIVLLICHPIYVAVGEEVVVRAVVQDDPAQLELVGPTQGAHRPRVVLAGQVWQNRGISG